MFPIEAGTDAAIPARASPAMSLSRSTLAMLATGMGTDASFDSGANGTRVAPASEINLSPREQLALLRFRKEHHLR
jgi:hypothetical protein